MTYELFFLLQYFALTSFFLRKKITVEWFKAVLIGWVPLLFIFDLFINNLKISIIVKILISMFCIYAWMKMICTNEK